MLFRLCTPCSVLNVIRSNRELFSTVRYRGINALKQSRTSASFFPLTSEVCLHKGHCVPYFQSVRGKKKQTISQLVVPVKVDPVKNGDNPALKVGVELAGQYTREQLVMLLAKFYQRAEIRAAALENGLDNHLYHQSYMSFRRYCLEASPLPTDLHVTVCDIAKGATHVDSLFPFFLQHAQQVFPHLSCLEDLKRISDLTSPIYWYPEARAITRKIVFHAGPTNSGKTYHALDRFFNAKSGVYCGPLKLLAVEVFHKSNEKGTPCDLVTGEERNYVNEDQTPASHVACTVEMVSVNTPYEVAVIDEIQMLRDPQRGWAWTRALLGVVAEEIHICGEAAAIDVVKEILLASAEDVEVRQYKRLTSLTIEDKALGSLSHIRPGDCVVCFSKQDIYGVSRQLEALGKECAVIYGSLPPGTKLSQSKKFNDPDHLCKVMVATDAIGMGLNLNIGRIIFYSMIKPSVNEKGEMDMDTISVSQALQIAGRAGRYGTQFSHGYVTTMKNEDLPTLKRLLAGHPEDIAQAGLHPTADQIELYAFHLPNATLSNLIDIFVGLCKVDDSVYFMCNMEDFKFLADKIQHVPLPLRTRYVFCCAPINRKLTFACSMFLKFARQYSQNDPITYDWLCRQIGWPMTCPNTLIDLVHLEAVFDVFDLYLWLSYRFTELFPDAIRIREMQRELDEIIQTGVAQLTRLLVNSENRISRGTTRATEEEEDVKISAKKTRAYLEQKVTPPTVPAEPIGVSGRLSERLLAEGLLTPKLLEELRKEWESQSRHPTILPISTEENDKKESHSLTVKTTKRKKKPPL